MAKNKSWILKKKNVLHGLRILKKNKFGMVCDVPHRIRENVPDVIYVEIPLNQVDAF